MPQSQWLIRITDTTGSQSAGNTYGANYRIISGSIDDHHKWVTEKLEAAGVDGCRLRRLHKKKDPLVIEILEGIAQGGYQGAETLINIFEGTKVNLTLNHNNRIITMDNYYCTNIAIIERSGQLFGFGESARSLLWQAEFTKA